MKSIYAVVFLLGVLNLADSYSKFGRSCKDIGCASNEKCIMETKQCSYHDREDQCGSYPTCVRTGSSVRTSCDGFICPPSQVCKMVGSSPRCMDDHSAAGHVGYSSNMNQDSNAPSAPLPPNGGNLYPAIPRGETTPRPRVQQPYPGAGSGYQGGSVGSGYPGQQKPGSYPSQGGYQGGYPGQGYPGQGGYQGGYPGQGYPGQGGYQGYPQQNRGGYQGGYYQQPNNNQQNRYGQKNSGSSFTDQITEQLKNIGTSVLSDTFTKLISGGGNTNTNTNANTNRNYFGK